MLNFNFIIGTSYNRINEHLIFLRNMDKHLRDRISSEQLHLSNRMCILYSWPQLLPQRISEEPGIIIFDLTFTKARSPLKLLDLGYFHLLLPLIFLQRLFLFLLLQVFQHLLQVNLQFVSPLHLGFVLVLLLL